MKLSLIFFSSFLYSLVLGQEPVPTRADSLKRDNELRLFLAKLHVIAINKDTTQLFPLINENAETQPMWMDGVYASGRQDFIRFWKLRIPGSKSVFWQLLQDVSQMDGQYTNPDNLNGYILPRYDRHFEESKWIVMADSLPVYSDSTTKSSIIRWLPKGTPIYRNYGYQLPSWIIYADPSMERKQTEWIQTNILYTRGWRFSLRYKNGNWTLSGISGFEPLYPKE